MTPETRKITVLHVILSLEIGGMEQVVADLVRNLDRGRFRPVVVCLETLGPIAQEITTRGIRVIQLPPMIPKLSLLFPAQLVKVIRETRADVIHAHSGCWFKAAMAGRLAGVRKIIYTEHGRTFPDPKGVILMDRLISRLTSRVIAVSQELSEYLLEIVGIPDRKIEVIINGIDMNRFSTPSGKPHGTTVCIGIIARLAPVKDIGTLLKAMQIVLRECPDTLLQVVGDGPERDKLEKMAVDLGVGNKVEFSGFRRDIPEILSGIDIFTLTSLSEGTSITILEAMAAGIPVVATRVGGNPALIEEGVNGFLVSADHQEGLAQALLRLVRDESLRKRIGAINRKKAEEEHSIQSMTARYEKLYISVMNKE
jgi:sugar transferase (PEP-CTERM/EpsH1 system associated)